MEFRRIHDLLQDLAGATKNTTGYSSTPPSRRRFAEREVILFGRFVAVQHERTERTSGKTEQVFVVRLDNGRTVLVREKPTVWVLAEVPKDNSTAAVVGHVHGVVAELERIEAKPSRVPVDLELY
jgi:hypothetical protein